MLTFGKKSHLKQFWWESYVMKKEERKKGKGLPLGFHEKNWMYIWKLENLSKFKGEGESWGISLAFGTQP